MQFLSANKTLHFISNFQTKFFLTNFSPVNMNCIKKKSFQILLAETYIYMI